MIVTFTRVSDDRHTVRVERSDGTTDTVELDTRSFLFHDLAHLAVESELGLSGGVWGSVANGGRLSGEGLDGADMELAEALSGPMQTMLRTGAGVDEIEAVLSRSPLPEHGLGDVDVPGLAAAIHQRLRALGGHWAATPFGGSMHVEWTVGRGPGGNGSARP